MLKNQEMAEQIYDMMNTAIDASWQMKDFLFEKQMDVFAQVSEDLYALLDSIRQVSKQLDEEQAGMNLWASSESVCVSLERIRKMPSSDTARAAHKIEFELVPLLEEMRVRYYYFGLVYPDEEKMKRYYEKDIHELAKNRYVEEAEKTGSYKYDLSISVKAYNKLEYTKQCLAALKAFLPENISYELILINHGSDDGTKEFFESQHPDKQLDIAVNGGGSGAITRIVEGRFYLGISNDVLVMENAIQNMYDGMCADETIGYVVPATTNVSNLQAPERGFESLEEVRKYAHENNVRNPYRWEQRTRLVDPLGMRRSFLINILCASYYFQSLDIFSFPDDRVALLLRRNGYKLYLAKDSFCFHYGSVTLGSTNTAQRFDEGRKNFKKIFGIDPWMTGFCHSYTLFHELEFNKKGSVRVLGINCGLGSDSLKIKEILKEQVQNTDVYLKNITTRKEVLEDLKGVSDEAVCLNDYSEIKETDTYDYIICEDFEPVYISLVEHLKNLLAMKKKDGMVIVSVVMSIAEEVVRTSEEIKKHFSDMQIVSERQSNRCWIVV